MAQIVGCLEGMSEACVALDMPIVSRQRQPLQRNQDATGSGSAILPTPAIGAVGLIDDWATSATIAFKDVGEEIFVVGTSTGSLGQSLWLRECHGRGDGAPPSVDLAQERRLGEFIRAAIHDGLVSAVHDVSDGGLLVAIAEMALAGNIGADLEPVSQVSGADGWFAEDQGRFVVTVAEAADQRFIAAAKKAGVAVTLLGYTEGDAIHVDNGEVTLGRTPHAPTKASSRQLMGADAALA